MIDKKIFLMLSIIFVIALIPSASAASVNNTTQTVTVTVKPTISISIDQPIINFGSLDADGLSTIKTTTITSNSNIAIDIWTKALNFVPIRIDGLTLSNFAFSNASTYSSYTNSYQMLFSKIPKTPKSGSVNRIANQRITVPFGTNPGTYNTTVYYTAVQTGTAAPIAP